jgi:hypothetical protein
MADEKNATSLKDVIKTRLKNGLEGSLKSVFSEEDQKNMSGLVDDYSNAMASVIVDIVDNPMQEKKLQTLYNNEKHYLDILKDYKEEIKFATSLQAEIRKEQAAFFSSTLKEVCNSLKETQMTPECQAQWINDLVLSYTSSLKISSKLAEEHVMQLLGEIQEEAEETLKKSNNKGK